MVCFVYMLTIFKLPSFTAVIGKKVQMLNRQFA